MTTEPGPARFLLEQQLEAAQDDEHAAALAIDDAAEAYRDAADKVRGLKLAIADLDHLEKTDTQEKTP